MTRVPGRRRGPRPGTSCPGVARAPASAAPSVPLEQLVEGLSVARKKLRDKVRDLWHLRRHLADLCADALLRGLELGIARLVLVDALDEGGNLVGRLDKLTQVDVVLVCGVSSKDCLVRGAQVCRQRIEQGVLGSSPRPCRRRVCRGWRTSPAWACLPSQSRLCRGRGR